MSRRLLLAAIAAVSAAPLSAQVLGLPVVNSGVPAGIALGVDYGSANADYGKGTAIGGSAAIGVGYFGVSAAISRFSPDQGDAVWAPGVGASMRVLGGPLVPLRVMLAAGLSRWSVASVSTTHIPVSLGISATIPNPAFAIKPWIAPRVDASRTSGKTDTHFGMSGGIDLSLLSGLSFRGAYDRLFVTGASPSVISFGIGFAR